MELNLNTKSGILSSLFFFKAETSIFNKNLIAEPIFFKCSKSTYSIGSSGSLTHKVVTGGVDAWEALNLGSQFHTIRKWLPANHGPS